MGRNKQTIYASFVGINQYDTIPGLEGCIRDILQMDQYVRNLHFQQSEILDYHPIYFLSPNPHDLDLIHSYCQDNQVKLEYSLPTFEKVTLDAFEHLAKANGNDICLFYFSGHGSYTRDIPTCFEGGQNETLLCMDSRSTRRDLMDKELAFLLHKTLDGKPDVHCLVVTDSCHSGGSMRGESDIGSVKFRNVPSSSKKTVLSEYLGYKEGFFRNPNSLANTRYVHLAACGENEKAGDTKEGGMFSLRLLQLLNKEEYQSSYRDLMQSLNATFSNHFPHRQNPVAFAWETRDLDRPFLGSGFTPYSPTYELRFNPRLAVWQMHAGSLLGITPSSSGISTTIRIKGTNWEAKVVSVDAYTSIVEGKDLEQLDRESNFYRAYLVFLAIPKMIFDFEGTSNQQSHKKQLIESFDESSHLYIRPKLEERDDPKLTLQITTQKEKPLYSLHEFRYLRPESDPGAQMNTMNAIGKWNYIKGIQSANSYYHMDQFSFNLKKREGGIDGKEETVLPGEEIKLSYHNGFEPAFYFSISFATQANLPLCHIQALYMDSLFGIDNSLIENRKGDLRKNESLYLKLNNNPMIKVHLNKCFGVHEKEKAYDFLRIFVSAEPFSLDTFKQVPFKPQQTKSGEMIKKMPLKIPKAMWAVFDFPILIHRPIDLKSPLIRTGKPNDNEIWG